MKNYYMRLNGQMKRFAARSWNDAIYKAKEHNADLVSTKPYATNPEPGNLKKVPLVMDFNAWYHHA